MLNFKRLEQWMLSVNVDPYLAPELMSVKLRGKVYNHPRYPEGHAVNTSRAVAFDPVREIFKTYSGSYYQLGDPDPEYESAYPDARNRMIAQLSKLEKISVSDEMMTQMHGKDREALEAKCNT